MVHCYVKPSNVLIQLTQPGKYLASPTHVVESALKQRLLKVGLLAAFALSTPTCVIPGDTCDAVMHRFHSRADHLFNLNFALIRFIVLKSW